MLKDQVEGGRTFCVGFPDLLGTHLSSPVIPAPLHLFFQTAVARSFRIRKAWPLWFGSASSWRWGPLGYCAQPLEWAGAD